MGDDEADVIRAAVSFCRGYTSNATYRLLFASHRLWQETLARAKGPGSGESLFLFTDELLSALVGWVLIWRLILDQTDYNIASRFGHDSEQRAKFKEATSAAYDSRQGYRLVEAIRNLIQHREMPPLNFTHTTGLDPQSGQLAAQFNITFPVAWLLASPKCPATIKREFQSRAEETIDLAEVVEDAMVGFRTVFEVMVSINAPELGTHIDRLRHLFAEVHPEMPVILRPPSKQQDGSLNIPMERFDDLLLLVTDAPFGTPYNPRPSPV